MKAKTRIMAAALAVISCLLLSPMAVAVENSAPIAENLELTTYRGVSVGGRLSAVDPDGDVVTFEITTQPKKGTINLAEDGRFVYTPADGKKGKDYFGYKATDSEGNVSQEATVIITIVKQKNKLSYCDMEGNGAYYAALRLAEEDLFVGECIGNEYVFDADREITRAEFLVLCMELSGADLLTGTTRTGFLDDSDIPTWIKPYVSTALMTGAVSGYSTTSGGAVFDPYANISYFEAAVMLDNIIELTDVVATSLETVPTWAAQAASNLSACSIMDGVEISNLNAITRAEAAVMLSNAMDVINNR